MVVRLAFAPLLPGAGGGIRFSGARQRIDDRSPPMLEPAGNCQ
jgi:hypothetical protein